MDQLYAVLDQQVEVVVVDLGYMHGLQARAQQTQLLQATQRAQAGLRYRVGYLAGSLVEMHVNRHVQFVRQGADAGQVLIADGVGSVWAERDADQAVVTGVIAQAQSLGNRLFSIACARYRIVYDRKAQLGPDTRVHCCGRGYVREEIHVGKTGCAAAQHLGNRKVSAQTDKIGVDPAAFCGPYMVCQPCHQRQIVGQTTEQRHRCVAMSVDQARNQDMVWQVASLARIQRVGGGHRHNADDAPLMDCQGMIFKDLAVRDNGHDPAWHDQQIELAGQRGHVQFTLHHGRQVYLLVVRKCSVKVAAVADRPPHRNRGFAHVACRDRSCRPSVAGPGLVARGKAPGAGFAHA